MDPLKNLFKQIVNEGKAELGRLGTLGADELAAALFRGHAFVQYGPGQKSPDKQHDVGQPAKDQEPEIEQQNHGMEL